MNVLINAYAVSPNHGSEPGVGWNWIIEIAKYCNVHVITEAEFKNEIDLALQSLTQKDNIQFYFNDIGDKARKMCWNQGDYRFYYYYKKWQKKTYKIALEIIENNKIDIIHQLNMIGYREPGYLWNIKEIPFVWGPIGGFNFVKTSFLSSLGLKNIFFYTVKNLANTVQAITNSRVRKSINRANLLLAASGNTQQAIKKFYNKESVILNETGCQISNRVSPANVNNNEEFNVVWVGRFIPTKLLNLALDVIKKVEHLEKLKFHIVGAGVNDSVAKSYKEYAKKLGIQDICTWHGNVPRDNVDKIMNDSDLFFFTSIVEATSTVVMEAITNSLPILCFDNSGHSAIINEDIGRKIPVTNLKKSKELFAKEIENLYSNRSLLQQMSEKCNSRIIDLSWQAKGEKIYQLYIDILNQRTISNQ